MEASFEFPTVTPNDASDVAVAIETARALWRSGDPRESLRWLRRAAESAEAEGDDYRALTLARAAAELQEEFRPSALPAPPASRPVPPAPPSARSAPGRMDSAMPPLATAAAPTSAPARSSAVPPAPRLEPWLPPTERQATPPPLPSQPRSEPPPLPGQPKATRPAVEVKQTAQVVEFRSGPASARRAEPQTSPDLPFDLRDAAPDSPPKRAGEAEVPTSPGNALPEAPQGVETRVTLRVSVESFSRGAFLVRMLGEGESAPPGSREALLVPTSPGVDLRSPD
jgi:hypothetical protein